MIKRLQLLLAGVLVFGSVGLSGAIVSAADFDLFPNETCKDARLNSDNPSEKPVVCADGNAQQTQDDNSIYGPNGIISKIVNILAIIIGVAAIIVIIVAGIQYMLSTGDPTKVNNAKNAILYAITGLIVAVIARQAVLFIVSKLGA